MNVRAYYNEFDPFAAQWLRNLIAAGHIAAGDVDERSIVDVRAADLADYTQCHFFAGIGGWSLALRLAGWPDDRPVWTGSCPCQPFSSAGKGKAADDERHLWPSWFPLIAEQCPPVVFGEQVEAAIGWGWLDVVFADLESQGYACGATDLCAAGVGAPHIRQRVWWVADAGHDDGPAWAARRQQQSEASIGPERRSISRRLADAVRRGAGHGPGEGLGAEATVDGQDRRLSRERLRLGIEGSSGLLEHAASEQVGLPRRTRLAGSAAGELGNANQSRQPIGIRLPGNDGAPSKSAARQAAQQTGNWNDCDWLPCRDGKARPVEPGTFPLAHGIPGRVGRLRAYGNAIVAPLAAEFISSFLETEGRLMSAVSAEKVGKGERDALAARVQSILAEHLKITPDRDSFVASAEFFEITGTGPASYAIVDALAHPERDALLGEAVRALEPFAEVHRSMVMWTTDGCSHSPRPDDFKRASDTYHRLRATQAKAGT